MSREEIWITDILDVRLEGECVRAEFSSGGKAFVLRGSLHTTLKALELGRRTIAKRRSAEVVPLPGH